MDQRSIVLHLKGPSTHVIHDDLVATRGPKAVAYSTVTRYLREAVLGTIEVTLDPEPRSLHLDDSVQALVAALEEKKSPFSPYENLPKPSISHALPSIEGSPNGSGSCDFFFPVDSIFYQTLRR
jgi:hypothetical protein